MIAAAELRLGGHDQQVVRITRTDGIGPAGAGRIMTCAPRRPTGEKPLALLCADVTLGV